MAYYNINTDKLVRDNVPARKRLQLPVLGPLISALLSAFTRWSKLFVKYK